MVDQNCRENSSAGNDRNPFASGSGNVVIKADRFEAVIFDMDGVVTKTSIVHTSAWKQVFDDFLKSHSGGGFQPFSEQDYLKYVDSKCREDGIRDFLKSRKIALPDGTVNDKPGFDSVYALGNLKNAGFLQLLRNRGVECYETTVALIRSLKEHGVKVGIVTASRNGQEILSSANLSNIFDVEVDGMDAARLGLRGKPHPATFLEAALRLGVSPQSCVVVEDAAPGVAAAHRGHFGLVIGVARGGGPELLKKNGADVVVTDLAEVSVSGARGETARPGMAMAEMNISDDHWVLRFDDFSPEEEKRRESLCALGNGYFCTRGSAPESRADEVHYPGTYLAGGYNRVTFQTGDEQFQQDQLVNLPNWLSLTFKVNNGDWFSLKDVEILSYKQSLDTRAGVVQRQVKFRDSKGQETSLAQRWLVHMHFFHLAALESIITAENWSGTATVRTALDGRVVNSGDRLSAAATKHIEPLDSAADGDTMFLHVLTNQSKLAVAQAARTICFKESGEIEVPCRNTVEPLFVGQEFDCEISEKESLTVHKIVSMFTSRDQAISEAGLAARQQVAKQLDFYDLLDSHMSAWRRLWRRFDLFLETTEAHSRIIPALLLHFNCFHALQAASPHVPNLDVGLPARGWTGEGYEGHIFWDDVFIFPFINFRAPSITQTLLKYRYRRLSEAREIARSFDAQGARFPWQSASDGTEETLYLWLPDKHMWVKDRTRLQAHVNAAIAFNIWQYYQVTSDLDFMHTYGAEMLFEIARFFATYAVYNENRERYEIHGVVGPDEYHTAYPDSQKDGINNNAYTNVMAVWTLCRALDFLHIMPSDRRQEIRERLDIRDGELEQWERVSKKMFIPFLDEDIIAQFEGYDKLEEFPWKPDQPRDLKEVVEALKDHDGSLNEYKISKQADVLTMFYILSADELKQLFNRLGYRFSWRTIEKSVEYYLPRTANLSTLSRVVHAWVLSRLDRVRSWDMWSHKQKESMTELWPVANGKGESHSWDIFIQALGTDFTEVAHGAADEGVHLAAMAGAIDIVQRCYTGIETREGVLWLNPQLPGALTRLSFSLHYRDQALNFDITQTKMKVTARHSSALPIKIGFKGEIYELNAGESKEFNLMPDHRQVNKKIT